MQTSHSLSFLDTCLRSISMYMKTALWEKKRGQISAYLTVHIHRGSGQEVLHYSDVATSGHHVETRRASHILGEDNQIAVRCSVQHFFSLP